MKEKKLTRKEKIKQQLQNEADPVRIEHDPKPENVSKEKATSWFTLNRKLGLIVAAFAFLIYANSIDHGYVLDDSSVIKDNWVVKRGVEGIPIILKTGYRYGYWSSSDSVFRPLSLMMFATEWEISPDTPFLHHLINVLFYALTGFLLFSMLNRMYGKINIVIPFAITMLYVAHPLHTEIVANIKSRDAIMSLFLGLSALYCMFKYIETERMKYALFMGLCYMVSIFSNESSITFLAIVPLINYFYTGVSVKKNMQISGIFVAAAAACVLIRIMILGGVDGNTTYVALDNFLVAAPDYITRLATSVMVLGKYIVMLVFPHPLSSDYSFNQIPVVDWTSIYAMFSFVFFLVVGIYALVKLKTKNHIAFGILYFFASVSLFSNIIMLIGVGFGERLMYFPSLGFVIVLGHLLAKVLKVEYGPIAYSDLVEVFKKNAKYVGIIGVILALYSFKTISRNVEWESNYTLYSADVKKSSKSARAHYFYGLELTKVMALAEPDLEKRNVLFLQGIEELKIATRIYPNYADAYSQIGLTYYRMNNYDLAQENYLKALEYNSKKPLTYSNLGAIYFNRKQYQEALEMFQRALTYDPRFADAYLNIGSVYGTLGQNQKSIDAFNKGIEYAPKNAHMWYFAAITYQNMGDKVNADKYYRQAFALNPALRPQGQ